MLKKIFYAAAFMLLTFSCTEKGHHHGENEDHSEHETHEAHEHGPEHKHDHDHGETSESHTGEIKLEPERAEQFGVGITKAEPSDFASVIKVSGKVESAQDDRSVISATSSGTISFAPSVTEGTRVSPGMRIASITAKGIAGGDPNEAARVALDAAKQELDRATPLHADGIISTRDYNMIKLEYERARAAYSGSGSGSAAVSRQNGVITRLLVKQGEYVETGRPIAEVSGNTRLTLRADLPEKYASFYPTVVSANFRPSYSDEVVTLKDLNGKMLSGSTVVADRAGYLPVYFSFDNNGKAVPGAFAEVYLVGTPRHNVISVPAEAISEQQGTLFVYVRLDEECYEKRPVITGQSDGVNVEIVSGLNPGEDVVTAGMTFVKLAETTGVVPEGHHHH